MNERIILLADDDIDDREMFCEALSSIDDKLVCNCSENGKELIKRLKDINASPQLIFLDLNMPVMNGWQCLKLLKEDERYKHIPVIMISTSSHQREMDIASNLGALCYFVKPNRYSELKQVLQTIISGLENGLKEAIIKLQAENSEYIFSCSDN